MEENKKRCREDLDFLSNKVKEEHRAELNRRFWESEEPKESEIERRKRIRMEKRMKNERILKRRKVKEYLSLMSPEELEEYDQKKRKLGK